MLHTDRLVMMPLGPDDLDEAAALYADPDVMRYVAGGVIDRAATGERLDRVAEGWRSNGHGPWAIRDSTTGAFLGEGGIQRLAVDVAIETEATVAFGYTLSRRSSGKGYATESGEAMLRDAWDRFDWPVIHALVTTDNLTSQKALRRLGFKKRSRIDHDDRPHQLWTLDRPG